MSFDWENARDVLRDWRDSNLRNSEETVELGRHLIKKFGSYLKDELWLICEQVFIASLDICCYDVADMCLNKLLANFPVSVRVKKLEGMKLEAQGNSEEALKIYEELEKEDPTNAAIKKRKIALIKNKDHCLAIKPLTVYLQTFAADQDAWMELADLYVEQMDYSKAAFCVEELILSNSFNHLYHQRYAEIKYSQGGDENIKIARQYFAQAVKLSSSTNMRALYGLLLTSSKLSKTKESNNQQYAKWAGKMIVQKYQDVWEISGENSSGLSTKLAPNSDMPQLVASVNQMLKQFNISDN